MKKLLFGMSLAVILVSLPAMAQGPGSDPVGKAMGKIADLLAKSSFSAKALMTISGAKQKMPEMEFEMVTSEGKTRIEIDFTKMMASAGGEAEGMPAMGKMVTISLPAKKMAYQIMTVMKAYCETPIPDAADGSAETPKVVRKVEGKETVEGYDCEKVRNTITTKDGTTVEVFSWEAKKLDGIPVKTETKTPEGTFTMTFKDIKTGKPPASAFEIPAGFTKYNSMQEMMMQGIMKMMQQMP